jgi:predicted glutamine amidotransferase
MAKPGSRRGKMADDMCRMLAAPLGAPGDWLFDAFVRMAEGQNALHELNRVRGSWVHADGWGVVYDGGRGLELYRSARPCWEDPNLDRFRDARVLLLHARRASCGEVRRENVQPFEGLSGRERWYFGHNGTVFDPLPGRIEGATDSEWLFRRLTEADLERDPLVELRSLYGGLRDYTSLNTLLLGPEELSAVCLSRSHPRYYSLASAETDYGPVVASEPLTGLASNWTTMANGSALRIDRKTGRMKSVAFLSPADRRTP